MKRDRRPAALIRRYAARRGREIALLTATFLTGSALLVCAPRALSGFIDRVYDGSPWLSVLLAIAAYLALTLARLGANALLNAQLASLGQSVTDELRRDALAKYLSLDARTLAGVSSGEAMTRIDEDAEGLFQYYYVLLYKLAGSALTLIAILAALAARSLPLCAALLLVSCLFLGAFKRIQDKGVAKYVRSSQAAAEFNGSVKELISGAAALRALGAERYADTTLRRALRKRYAESFPASQMYGNLWSAATLMECAVIGSGLAFAAAMWDAGAVSLGTAYMIYSYAQMVCDPLQDFRNHMGTLQQARAGILRTLSLLETPGAPAGGTELPDAPLDIEVAGLEFAYGRDGRVLRGLNLRVPAGRAVGVIGETGCGKSTLLGCVAGANPFEGGSVRIGGVAIGEISPRSLRERVGFCPQRARLLHATLRENIALMDESVSDGEILSAARALGLTTWLEGFPEGLDTPLGLGEGSVSSGEARLIALMRLALRRPRVVLLDEATAALDERTERYITRAVRALCQGRTVLAVSHNEKSLDWMDEIARMENGALVLARKGGGAHAVGRENPRISRVVP